MMQDRLDADQWRQWESSGCPSVFGDEAVELEAGADEEVEDPFTAGEGVIFHGLFGLIPDSGTGPLRFAASRPGS